jgi:A/G-specific adenine glycosylase
MNASCSQARDSIHGRLRTAPSRLVRPKHGRHDLPWQRDATPYHVWLSEIMLQQTQVATVIPYYERFTRASRRSRTWPRADDRRGAAPLERPRLLRPGAQPAPRGAPILVAEYNGGEFPATTSRRCRHCPASAAPPPAPSCPALSVAAQPILDGNVKRVLARYHAVTGWPGQTAVARQLWELAEEHTPRTRVADYTQAIMDLGATLCTRSRPACERCPQAMDCAAHAAGRQADFPGRKPRKTLPTRRTVFVVAATPDGEMFLQRRPPAVSGAAYGAFPRSRMNRRPSPVPHLAGGGGVRRAGTGPAAPQFQPLPP